MKSQTNTNHNNAFENFASHAAKATGSTYAFTIAMIIVIVWAVSGPFFDYSETWQLVINTGTTIITFLMVFLIQKAQNKDSLAIQLKLNELVASSEYASNRVVDIENMTEDEMVIIQKYYRSLSDLSKKDGSLKTSHSIEEAEDQHEEKTNKIRQRTTRAKLSAQKAADHAKSLQHKNSGSDASQKSNATEKLNASQKPKMNSDQKAKPNDSQNPKSKDNSKPKKPSHDRTK